MSIFNSYVVHILSATISGSIVWLLLSKLVKKTPRFIGTTFKGRFIFLVMVFAIYIVIKVNIDKYITNYIDIWDGAIVGIWISVFYWLIYKELPKKEKNKEKIQ